MNRQVDCGTAGEARALERQRLARPGQAAIRAADILNTALA
jgi:hypothetical protein